MKRLLKRIVQARRSIAVELYAGIGGAVALTLLASIVAFIAFERVGDAQSKVNEGSVPDMAAAFSVSQHVADVVDTAPRLAAADSYAAFEEARAEVERSLVGFEESLTVLAGRTGESEGLRRVRVWDRTMRDNIASIDESVAERVKLADQIAKLNSDVNDATLRLTQLLDIAIDDQYFYTMTGFRELDDPPVPRSVHFTENELERFRGIAKMRESIAVGSQLLTSMATVVDYDMLEPLRERYEASSRQFVRNMQDLEGLDFGQETADLIDRLNVMSMGEEGVYELRARFLLLAEGELEKLQRNREVAISLVDEVQVLAEGFRVGTLAAARASAVAIRTGRNFLVIINVISVTGAVLMAWLFVGRVVVRRLEVLSRRMRSMAGGALEGEVEVEGHDEVADMAAALEVLRRHALEVQRLNLVEKLAADLQSKNSELEAVLADLQKAQDQIVMREKLAALGELTAGVAHEIKNPLNFVKNFAEISEELLEELLELVPEGDEPIDGDDIEEMGEICEDLTENLQSIRRHGERANRIVNDMLMMGREERERRPAEINGLVREHVALAYHSMRAADPNFNVTIDYDMDDNVGELECVPQDLGRVVLNLVTNACHATEDKRQGAGSDYSPTIRVQTSRSNGNVEIGVRDNGKGIPEDIREKIFNPFFTTKDTNKGTGLGLALSNDIVREHGGEMQVDSEPGEYTRMLITLPVEAPALEVAQAQ